MVGYMGDKASMIVHHLARMSPECKIYDVKKENMIYFVPDTLNQAKKEGFLTCKQCREDNIENKS
jgi:methylphosphotriester-DNA--protein-cysteine methyltransferase